MVACIFCVRPLIGSVAEYCLSGSVSAKGIADETQHVIAPNDSLPGFRAGHAGEVRDERPPRLPTDTEYPSEFGHDRDMHCISLRFATRFPMPENIVH